MFWNIFKNKNTSMEEKPKIKIYDEKLNKEIEVEQEQWIKKFLKPQLNQNKDNKEIIYTLLVEALNYNIYKEILEYSLRFRENDLESLRSTEIIIEIYYNSGAYDEVINLFEKYNEDGFDLSSDLYYYYAKSYEKLSNNLEYENAVIDGIYKFPNSSKLIKEFYKFMPNKTHEEIENIKDILTSISNAYRLSIDFALLEYENLNYSKANEYILKAIKHCNNNLEILIEISKILFKYKQFNEFENYILPNFELENRRSIFANIILEYYSLTLNYNSGLELLNEMYERRIYDRNSLDLFYKYENDFLKLKYKNEKPEEYKEQQKRIINDNISYSNILHPLYYYVLNRNPKIEVKKDDERSIMYLPIAFEKDIDLPEEIYNTIYTIPLIILEKIYRVTDIKFQVTYMKNKFKLIDKIGIYNIEFLRTIAKSNKNLKYIITGKIKEIENGYAIEFYRYKCSTDTLETILEKNIEQQVDDNFVMDVLEEFNKLYNIVLTKSKYVSREDLISAMFRLMLFMNFDGYNIYRKWTMLWLLEYSLKSCKNEEGVLTAISIVKFMNIYNIKCYERFRTELYELNSASNNNREILMMIKEVFEGKMSYE